MKQGRKERKKRNLIYQCVLEGKRENKFKKLLYQRYLEIISVKLIN